MSGPLVGLLVLAVACEACAPPPPVVVRSQGGSVDVELGLRQAGRDRLRAEALDGRTRLGFDIVLDPEASVVHVQSLGSRSDAFLSFLDARYGTGRRPGRMRGDVKATAIALDENDKGLNLKLFFEDQGEVEAASDDLEGGPGTPEIYLNLGFDQHRVCWCEKDDGYRSDLVFALTEPPRPR